MNKHLEVELKIKEREAKKELLKDMLRAHTPNSLIGECTSRGIPHRVRQSPMANANDDTAAHATKSSKLLNIQHWADSVPEYEQKVANTEALQSKYKARSSVGTPDFYAHGYIPQFDGAADSLPGVQGKNIPKSKVGTPSNQATKTTGEKAEPSWCVDGKDQLPSSAEVAKFFERISEDERAEIAKYKAENRLV